jgi:hypothetical protein
VLGPLRVFKAFATCRSARNFLISAIAFFKAAERYVIVDDSALYSTIRDKAL